MTYCYVYDFLWLCALQQLFSSVIWRELRWNTTSSLFAASNQDVTMVVPDLSKPQDRGEHNGLDFRIIITPKDGSSTMITFVASTPEEKNAWCTDLSQVR